MPVITWQVTAPHFCAGIVSCGDMFRTSAPILGWVRRSQRNVTWFAAYCRSKGWSMRVAGIDQTK